MILLNNSNTDWFEDSLKKDASAQVIIPLTEYQALLDFKKQTCEKQNDKIVLCQHPFETSYWLSTKEAIDEIRELLEPELLCYAKDAKIKFEESKKEFTITNYIKGIFQKQKK